MRPEDLVNSIKSEIGGISDLYAQGAAGETEVGVKLDALGLNDSQHSEVILLIKKAMEEAAYTLICGLEGEASIGGTQHTYRILDEAGNELSGELGALFYDALMR